MKVRLRNGKCMTRPETGLGTGTECNKTRTAACNHNETATRSRVTGLTTQLNKSTINNTKGC